MDFEKNWQYYRSVLRDKPALFAVNLGLTTPDFTEQLKYPYILQFSLYYQGDQFGLPEAEYYQEALKEISKLSGLLMALPEQLFVGYTLSDNQIRCYFYCEKPTALIEILQEYEPMPTFEVQEDPNWDTYFDFLLPSPLEMKINATEDILAMLTQNGRNLSQIYLVEHGFYLTTEEDMQAFLEYLSLSDMPLSNLKHSRDAMMLDEQESVYLVKVEQEISLDNHEIFYYVEQFEQLAQQFSGEYIGWECQELMLEKSQLN